MQGHTATYELFARMTLSQTRKAKRIHRDRPKCISYLISVGYTEKDAASVTDWIAAQNPLPAVVTSSMPTVHKTRFKELGYWHLAGTPSLWQCVDLTGDKPAQVGTQYATEKELLANLEAYATEYGCDGANPKPYFQNIIEAARQARAQGYAVVIFTPEELEGASVNHFQDRLIELGWEVISDLKPESSEVEETASA